MDEKCLTGIIILYFIVSGIFLLRQILIDFVFNDDAERIGRGQIKR